MTQAVDAFLAEVIEQWQTAGPLSAMLEIIDDVWRTNLDRHEPGTLGDDAMSLGTLCSRNIMNRCVKHFSTHTDGVVARGGLTLEMTYAGRILHLSKVPSQTPSWDPDSIDWDASYVRRNGARANAEAYTPTVGTLFDGTFRDLLSAPVGDPRDLTFLHLAWQGLSDAETRVFVGFPTTGPLPWSAVTLIHDGGSGGGGVPAPTTPVPALPTHDSLAEPTLPLRRRDRGEQTG